jgi:hypothetical protein
VRGIGLVPVPAAGLDLKSLHPGDPVCLIEATDEAVDAERCLPRVRRRSVIAIERPGRSATGGVSQHFGRNVGHCLQQLRGSVRGAEARGIWTIGIGDGAQRGRQWGRFRPWCARRWRPVSACGCGCGGGAAAVSLVAVAGDGGGGQLRCHRHRGMLALLTDDATRCRRPPLELRSLDASSPRVPSTVSTTSASPPSMAWPRMLYGAVLELIADAVDRARHRRNV